MCFLCVYEQIIYVKLSVVMGVGWVLGFVAAFTDWPALWYTFIVVNCLQGALLCVSFVLTRQVMRLLAECVRSLRRRALFATSNELFQTPTSPAIDYQDAGNSTAVIRLSLPEFDRRNSKLVNE